MSDKDKTSGGRESVEPAQHTRREDGPRRQVSESVVFRNAGREIEGWALNVSRGGVRAVLESDDVQVGDAFDVVVGDGAPVPSHIVWIRPGKGGVVVGVAYDGAPWSAPPPPSTMPPAAPSGDDDTSDEAKRRDG